MAYRINGGRDAKFQMRRSTSTVVHIPPPISLHFQIDSAPTTNRSSIRRHYRRDPSPSCSKPAHIHTHTLTHTLLTTCVAGAGCRLAVVQFVRAYQYSK